MGIILEAEHLTYGYDEKRHAIEDLSIAFEEGKTQRSWVQTAPENLRCFCI